jgi:hypothetical protein
MLAAYYHAPFNVSRADLGFGTITMSTAGESDIVVNLATLTGSNDDGTGTSSWFWHYQGSGSGSPGWCIASDITEGARLKHHSRTPFHQALQTALQAAATTATWTNPSGLTVAFRRQDNPISYRFEYSEANFSITWSTAAGMALCGFAGNVSGDDSYQGVNVPTYVTTPTLEFTSLDSPDMEDEEVGNHMTPDDNSAGFGVSRYVARVRCNWIQQFNEREVTERRHAVSAAPWTLQDLVQYCRGEIPFSIATTTRGTTGDDIDFFSLQKTAWKPERASVADGQRFHVPFDCLRVGHGP